METLFFLFLGQFFFYTKSGSVYGCVDFTCSVGRFKSLLPLGPALILSFGKIHPIKFSSIGNKFRSSHLFINIMMLCSSDTNWDFCSKRAGDYFDNVQSVCDDTFVIPLSTLVIPLPLTSTFIFILSIFASSSSAVITSVGELFLHSSVISFCFTKFLVPQRFK